MVNRIWRQLFGQGIVSTPDNFGALGERPTHPKLLDFLARRFVQSGWSLKKMIELLVSTRAYCMSSEPSKLAREIDPSNKLLQHMPARRLEAEAIRDSLFAVSGRLDTSMYGPPPKRLRSYGEEETNDTGKQLRHFGDARRNLYQSISRNVPDPFLEVFDQPMPSVTRGRRAVTNVPAQSLTLMNSPLVTGLAAEWGNRLAEGEAHSVNTRVDYMFLKALGRPPSAVERDEAATYLAVLAKEHGVSEDSVLQNPKVWQGLAHSLFNFKEFIYVR